MSSMTFVELTHKLILLVTKGEIRPAHHNYIYGSQAFRRGHIIKIQDGGSNMANTDEK